MEFLCPTCQHPLTVGRGLPAGDTSEFHETITGVDCPNCGFVPLEHLSDECSEEEADEPTISFSARLGIDVATRISHFNLVRLIGQGGFGTVWLADDVNLGRRVALKLPHSRGKDLSGLLHEAQASAHLQHPNIVSIYEVGTEEGQLFIACEYIEGMTLRDLLTTGKPAVNRSVDLTIAIAGALDHAHAHRIVHRDVKPANILINRMGEPFVTDFGLAKRISPEAAETTISSEGQILGTARYMSPEQASGRTRETDHRSDIYALGVILFEMLTGHVPFRGNMRAILQQKIFDDPPSPRSLDASIPRDLETICLKCLERDPDKRYQSAKTLKDELHRFRNGEPILARPVSRLERAWRWAKRRPMIAGLVLSLFTSLSVGLAGVSFYSFQASRSAELLRESLYRAQMSLAPEHAAHGDIAALRQTLEQAYDPESGRDLRGFEWFYFNELVSPFTQIVNHGEHVDDVAVSGDVQLLATAGHDGTTQIWDSKTGSRIHTLTLDRGRFLSVEFAPAERLLATGSTDGFLRLWDPRASTSPLWELKHGPAVSIVRFSPDGKHVLTAGEKRAVRIWDVRTQAQLAEIPAGQAGTKDIRYSPDGSRLVIATADGRVRIRDTETHGLEQILEPNPKIEAIAVSGDGRSLITASYDGRLRLWSTTSGMLEFEEETNFGLIGDMEFLADTPVVAIVGTSGHMVFYDSHRRKVTRLLKSHFLTSGVLDRTADGRFLAIGSGEGTAKVLDASRIAAPNVIWHDSHLRGLQFRSDGRLVAAGANGTIHSWNIDTGDSTAVLDPGSRVLTDMIASAPADRMAIAWNDRTITICRLSDGHVLRTLNIEAEHVAAMAFSPRGDRLAVAERGGPVLILPPEAGSVATAVKGTGSAPVALTFASTGASLLVAQQSGGIQFVDVETGAVEDSNWVLPDEPTSVVYCPASRRVAVGTTTGLIYLLDLTDRKVSARLKAHTSRINVLCVLPNGRTVVSGGRDRALRLWDTQAGELLTTLFGHDRQVFCIAASPDGQLLASGDLEGAIRIWRAPRVE